MCPDAAEDKTYGFSWENSVSDLQLWACVDSALRSSTGNMIMAGNATMVSKATIGASAKKSACGSEIVALKK